MSTDSGNIDQLFEALSHRDRRHLLVILDREASSDTPQKTLGTLSERLATTGDAKQVRVQLVHCHLPKLERYGLVRWNRNAETVEKGPEWATFEPFAGVVISYDPDLTSEQP